MPTKKPAKKPAPKTPAKKTVKAAPVKKPVGKTASAKATAKPAAKPAVKPVAKAAPVKAVKPAAKPAVKPIKQVAPPAAHKSAAHADKVHADSKPKTDHKVVEKAPAKTAATQVAAAPKRPEPRQESRQESKMPAQPKVVAIAESRKKPAHVAHDADDSDGENPTNLLAGPRNVTPYQVKRGEQYMNKVQLDHFRHILSSWKRDLMEEVDRTVHHMKDEAANFPDPNDRATQESEFSLELRTRDRERKLIRKIDEAIVRIDDGSYGYCVETGEEIGVKRLEARPVATLSVEAQERRERREKQYGDRDDRYR
jgi:DnaK suppressor protein